jgi:hypothetical protein
MTIREGAAPPLNAERLFYGGIAAVVLLIVVAGFGPSFYLRGIAPPYVPLNSLTPLILVHAAAFSLWVLLFLSQTVLIRTRRFTVHQRLGQFGVALAALMVVLGLVTAAQQVALGRPVPSGIPPLQWFAVPVFDIVTFAGFVAAGYAMRRHPQTHKRLMLLATVLLLQPAIGRLPLPPDALYGELATFVAWTLCLPLVAWDLFSLGRVHRATLIGVTVLAAEQFIRIAVWHTDEWHAVAAWLTAALT